MLDYDRLLLREGQAFPPVDTALKSPSGLLCMGGDLSPERLLSAYRQGIFPWYHRESPIQWWSPDPRAVLYLDQLHISKSLQRTLNKNPFEITFDQAFRDVMQACSEPRQQESESWIHPEMIEAYCQLNAMGHGFSIECWQDGLLVGGIYGVKIGRILAGESMFSRVRDASKIAIVHLAKTFKQQGGLLIDCQILNPHLTRLGATLIPREKYLRLIK